MEVITLDTLPC